MAFQSIIIIGGSSESRRARAMEIRTEKKGTHTDSFIVPDHDLDTSIKIEHVRALTHFFSRPPYSAPVKVAILADMENASLETQHALLKLLEEPPHYACIILTAAKREVFLPTIQSRVMTIKLPRESKSDWREPYNRLMSLLEKESGERLYHASEIGSSREIASTWLMDAIACARMATLERARSDPTQTKDMRVFLRTASRALTAVENTATHPRLLMENLLLELPRLPRLDPAAQ